jgi:hypothetical protein
VSLIMGSYGLPPSALRNIGLIAMGEFAGFILSSINSLSMKTPGQGFFDAIMNSSLNSSLPLQANGSQAQGA